MQYEKREERTSQSKSNRLEEEAVNSCNGVDKQHKKKEGHNIDKSSKPAGVGTRCNQKGSEEDTN